MNVRGAASNDAWLRQPNTNQNLALSFQLCAAEQPYSLVCAPHFYCAFPYLRVFFLGRRLRDFNMH
jgi:hypothetical protein